MKPHFILYVTDQRASARFYAHALGLEPTLDVPGMTEFALSAQCVLGLMPMDSIRRLLGERLPDPTRAGDAPKAELYLVVDDPRAYHARCVAAGARELSPLGPRDWGHDVAYSLDPDGHVLALARVSEGEDAERS